MHIHQRGRCRGLRDVRYAARRAGSATGQRGRARGAPSGPASGRASEPGASADGSTGQLGAGAARTTATSRRGERAHAVPDLWRLPAEDCGQQQLLHSSGVRLRYGAASRTRVEPRRSTWSLISPEAIDQPSLPRILRLAAAVEPAPSPRSVCSFVRSTMNPADRVSRRGVRRKHGTPGQGPCGHSPRGAEEAACGVVGN